MRAEGVVGTGSVTWTVMLPRSPRTANEEIPIEETGREVAQETGNIMPQKEWSSKSEVSKEADSWKTALAMVGRVKAAIVGRID